MHHTERAGIRSDHHTGFRHLAPRPSRPAGRFPSRRIAADPRRGHTATGGRRGRTGVGPGSDPDLILVGMDRSATSASIRLIGKPRIPIAWLVTPSRLRPGSVPDGGRRPARLRQSGAVAGPPPSTGLPSASYTVSG